ncbi:invasion associated locus B family protein, partial [Puniceibacterium confluentis]
MTRSILLLSTLAVLAAPPSWAQDTATPEAAAPATEAAPAAEAETSDTPEAVVMPSDSVLDTGEPADAAAPGATNRAQNDGTYTKTKSGAWDVQCLKVETGDEPCQMYQLLKDSQGSNVAEVSLFKVAGGGQVVAGATFVAPLETLLTQKLTIA